MKKLTLSLGVGLLTFSLAVAYDYAGGGLGLVKSPGDTVGVTRASASSEASNLNYTLDETTMTAEIIAATDVVDPYTGDIVVPATVTENGKTYTVTSIGYHALRETDITSVKLPSTIKVIKQGAFQSCKQLKTVELNDGLQTMEADAFENTRALEHITIPGSLKVIPGRAFELSGLKTVTLNPGVEIIKGAFTRCGALTSVNLPETIVELDGTFESCTALKEIILPSSLRKIGWTTFANTAITEIVVNDGFETLDMMALGNMNGDYNADYTLKKITLPSSIKTVNYKAFNNRRGLTDLVILSTVPPEVTRGNFESYTFNATLTVPEEAVNAYKDHSVWGKFSKIAAYVPEPDETFGFNYTLDESAKTAEIIEAADVVDPYTGDIVIPQTLKVKGKTYTVTSIGRNAFYNTPITSLELPSTIREIKQAAFQMCYDLTAVKLNEGLQTINWDAFNNCKALEQVTIPGSVKTVPDNAFGSSGLKTVTVNPGVEVLKNCFTGCDKLTSISLPETIVGLDGAFEDCSSLKEITLPSSLRNIGWFTFANTAITNIVINEGVEMLDMQSLGMMNGDHNADYTLKRVTLPSTLKKIDGMALNNRRGLTDIVMLNPVPPTAGDFGEYVYNAVLTVPVGSVEAYKAADVWKKFTKIKEADKTSDFDASRFRYTVGEGPNQYAVRISFNNPRRLDNLTWGYRSDDANADPAAILAAIAEADKRLEASLEGTNGSISFDLIGDGTIDARDVTAEGEWTITSNTLASDGTTRVITFDFNGSNQGLDYDFFVPAPDAEGVWLPESMTVKLSDEGCVLPALVQVPGGKLNSASNWQASTSNTSYRLDRTKIVTPYTLVDDTYNAMPTFVGATGTTYVRYRPQKVGEYKYYESNFMTLNIEEPEIPITAINVASEKITAGLNKQVDVDYTFEPANATYTGVKFTPADSKIASWTASNGLKSSATAGETTVTIQSLYNPEISATFTLETKLLNPVTGVNFGPGTEDGVINVPVRQLIGLKPVIIPADADIPDVTITLSDNGTSKEDFTCSTYKVNWWDADGERSQFFELSGHRPTGDKPAKLHVASADGAYERDFTVNVIEADRTPLEGGYTDGTIILNEEWFGHTNGGLNYITADDEVIYQAYEKENPGMAFGATSQYGTIWADKLIVVSKQAQDGGDPLPGGGRLVIADAKTLKRIGSLDNLEWEGVKGDGRGVAGATPDKIYVGSSNGIYIVDITDPAEPKVTGRIGKENSEDLYSGQIGDMTKAGSHVYAVMQSTGLIIINVADDSTTEISDPDIQGVTQSSDGNVWYATIKDGASVFVAINPATLEEVDRVTMPKEIGVVTCGWGAWRSTAFHGSPKTNDLWFVTGAAGIMGGASGDYYRYHIGDNPADIKPFFTLNGVTGTNGFGEEVAQMTYGTPRYDDRNDRLIVMTGKKGAASGGYRDHWIHYVDGTSGEITKSFHLNPYYWFQSLPIFPDKYAAEINIEDEILFNVDDSPSVIDLKEYVADADSYDSNINVTLAETAEGGEEPAAYSSEIANVSIQDGKLTVTPVGEGSMSFTLNAESNGVVSSKTVSVTVKRITGVESVSNDGISVRTLGKRIYVDGAEDRTLNIYNAAGFLMASFDIDSSDYIVELNVNAGIYIAEIDGVATKVILH